MKAIILDDEFMSASYLQTMVTETCPEVLECLVFHDPMKALLHLSAHDTDVLFLDIELGFMTAFDFIELAGKENLPRVIFTTAHAKYAVQAFRVHAIDYLMKPVVKSQLVAAMSRLLLVDKTEQEARLSVMKNDPQMLGEDRLILVNGQHYRFTRLEEIIRVQGSGSYSEFFLTEGRKVITSKNLKNYSKRLIIKGFLRPHQSHIVNLQHVLGINKADGGELLLSEDHRVPISTRLSSTILESIGLK